MELHLVYHVYSKWCQMSFPLLSMSWRNNWHWVHGRIYDYTLCTYEESGWPPPIITLKILRYLPTIRISNRIFCKSRAAGMGSLNLLNYPRRQSISFNINWIAGRKFRQ